MDTVKKTGIDASKTASKRVVQKTEDAIEDLIRNKTADKIHYAKQRVEKKNIKDKKFTYHQKKDSKLLMT